MSIHALVEQLNSAGVHDNFLSVGNHLATTKWRDICEDREAPVEDPLRRYALAVMLENCDRYIQSLDETTRAVAIGDFQKYALPMVRAIFPELIANDLVSVQPMLGPVSLVFYMDMIYGSSKGKVRKGDTAFSSVGRGPRNPTYSSSQIDEEYVSTGDNTNFGQSGTVLGGTLSYSPIVPGSIVITDGVQTATDDGNGGFTGDVTGGTIDYYSGTIANFRFANTPGSNVGITATYSYDMEANADIPQIDMVINHSPISARPRKLRANWSLEASYNLRSLHGLEAEVELTSALGAEIRFEIDQEIIDDLRRMAGSGSVYWTRSISPANVSFTEHKLSIIDAFVAGSNLIHKQTGRGRATWIVCGENVASVIETLPGFVPNPGMPNGMTKGAYRAGTLNGQWVVIKDPFYDDNSFLMGHKGMSFLEAGYVYAPYIPLYTTPTVVLDDFVARKGLATQYGKKAINPLFYVTGQIGTTAELQQKYGAALPDPIFGKAGRGVFGAY
jgi:hypothetical protein